MTEARYQEPQPPLSISRSFARREEEPAAGLTKIIDSKLVRSNNGETASAVNSRNTLDRAREYIESHIAEPILIQDVAAHSCASISKLERVFKRELQMTPTQYIISLRLIVARHALKTASPGDNSVSRIAMSCGFSHLGRFAGFYQRQFGELPSQTLQAQL